MPQLSSSIMNKLSTKTTKTLSYSPLYLDIDNHHHHSMKTFKPKMDLNIFYENFLNHHHHNDGEQNQMYPLLNESLNFCLNQVYHPYHHQSNGNVNLQETKSFSIDSILGFQSTDKNNNQNNPNKSIDNAVGVDFIYGNHHRNQQQQKRQTILSSMQQKPNELINGHHHHHQHLHQDSQDNHNHNHQNSFYSNSIKSKFLKQVFFFFCFLA